MKKNIAAVLIVLGIFVCSISLRAQTTSTLESKPNIVPGSPPVLTVRSITPTSFEADWTSQSGTLGYSLSVATDAGFTHIAKGPLKFLSGTLNTVVTGLNPGTTYFARVSGTGTTSNTVTVTTTPVPLPPTHLTKVFFDENSNPALLQIQWTASANATSYVVDYSTSQNFDSSLTQSITTTTTSVFLNNISELTYYYIRVRSMNAGFASANSSTIIAQLPLPAPKFRPAENVSTNQFMINWEPFDDHAYDLLNGYNLQVSTEQEFQRPNEQGIEFPSIGASETGVTVNVFDSDLTYYYRIQTLSADTSVIADSFMSDVGSVTLPPFAPAHVFSEPIDATSSDILWTAVTDATQYEFDLSTDSTFSAGNIYTKSIVNGLRTTITGLNPSNTYYFRVRTISGRGNGISSNSQISQVILKQNVPEILEPSSIDSTSFVANWNGVSGAKVYWLEVAHDSTFTSFVDGYSGIPTNSTSLLVGHGLSSGKKFYYRTRASNAGASGMSDYSQVASVQIAPAVATSAASDPFKFNIIPPSPEASALAKYADIPVSLYSGTPSISIPLYEVKERSLSLPVSLSYQATGHKVEVVAPRTGLGWTLNAGGVVTRTVRGWPDEHPRGWLRDGRPFNTIGDIVNKSDEDKFQIYDGVADGCFDAEPDLFYFNVNGYTGQFMFDADGTLKIISGNSIKIDTVVTNSHPADSYIQGWRITVDDGTTFTFTNIETTQVINSKVTLDVCSIVSETANNHMPQSWFLTDMRSADRNSWIHFDYDFYTQFNSIWSMEMQVHNPSASAAPIDKQRLEVTNFGWNLSKITTSSGQTTIDFTPSTTERADMANNFPLGQIDVKNSNNRQVEHWDLGYNYSTGRLSLATVTENVNDLSKPPYVFNYSGSIPDDITSFSQDHWGFFNGKPNTRLIPPTTMIVPGVGRVDLDGADRSPTGKVLNGLLTQITYPTGGKDVFTFEPHDYSFEQNQELIQSIVEPQVISVSAFVDGEDNGQKFTFHEKSFSITPRLDGKPTLVTVTFDYGFCAIPGFNGGASTPSALLWDNTRDKQVTGIGQIPRHNDGDVSTEIIQTFLLQPGDYTLSTQQAILSVNPNCPSPSAGFSLVTTVEFDQDTRMQFTNTLQGGGVRIAKIVRSFGNGNPDKVTKYDYTTTKGNQTISTGSLLESGYIYDYDATYVSQIGGTIAQDGNPVVKRVRFSQNRSALGTTQGSHVGYEQVTVTQGENGENGKSVYRYDSPHQITDNASFTVPFQPSETFDYQRGLLLLQADFAANSNDTLHVIKNKYTTIQDQVLAMKVGFTVNGTTVRGPGLLGIYAIGTYDNNFGYRRLVETRERIFNNGISHETVTTFNYAETTHKQLISSTVTDSKGDVFVTSVKYPKDYTGSTNAGINTMQSLHIDNVPVETLTVKKGSGNQAFLLSGIKTDFEPRNGGVTPVLKSSAKITTPVSTTDAYTAIQSLYEGRLSFKAFDIFNNPKQVALVDGLNTAYQWGYAGTLPVAKADNAKDGQIFYESFEELTGPTISSNHRTGQKSQTIAGSYSIPRASLPTVFGDYILSYWFSSNGTDWTYHEKSISNYSPASVISTDVVSGFIDEVRLYPTGALMTTITYEPEVGVTSVTDPGNNTLNYQYDGFGRLQYVKDLNGNIVEGFKYTFLQNVPFPTGN